MYYIPFFAIAFAIVNAYPFAAVFVGTVVAVWALTKIGNRAKVKPTTKGPAHVRQ